MGKTVLSWWHHPPSPSPSPLLHAIQEQSDANSVNWKVKWNSGHARMSSISPLCLCVCLFTRVHWLYTCYVLEFGCWVFAQLLQTQEEEQVYRIWHRKTYENRCTETDTLVHAEWNRCAGIGRGKEGHKYSAQNRHIGSETNVQMNIYRVDVQGQEHVYRMRQKPVQTSTVQYGQI